MSKVSIIILTYNSAEFIERLLRSILKFNKDEDFEVLVVDNNSEDDTVKKLQGFKIKDLRLKIIQNKENYGFAKGINIGVKQADGDYLLFINPDAEWADGSIEDMLSIYHRNEKIGIVGGKFIDKNGKSEKSCGKFFGLFESVLIAFGMDELFGVRFSPEKIQRVDFVSGGFMMIERKLFEKLSGFDENLFMYVEDMELCFRAKQMGRLAYFVPNATIVHEAHGSSNRSFAIKNIYRGILYFHKKHGNSLSYLIVKMLLVAKATVLVLLGKMINNKYLIQTYEEALKVI